MALCPDPAPTSDTEERPPLLRLPWHLILSCTDWLSHKGFVCWSPLCPDFCLRTLSPRCPQLVGHLPALPPSPTLCYALVVPMEHAASRLSNTLAVLVYAHDCAKEGELLCL